MKQISLAAHAGISQARLAEIEAGQGGGAPLEVWCALAEALGRYLRFEFARDSLTELVDAGHLAIQELVIRIAKAAGWEISFEAPSRAWESNRSIDVRLSDRRTRQIVVVECWNTFGDLGAATRSSNAKVRDEQRRAVAIAANGDPFRVGLVWVVRDTKANRELIARYPQIFESRFVGHRPCGWQRSSSERQCSMSRDWFGATRPQRTRPQRNCSLGGTPSIARPPRN